MAADFPASEYEDRLAKIQAAMRDAAFDALFFTTEAEMRYFTGFRTAFWQSPTRPWFLVLPARGKPIAIIPEIGAALMRETWIDDIRSWASPDPRDEGVSLVAEALSGFSRIGMPMGPETALRMPLADFETLRGRLRGSKFADATPIIQRQRMVKSEAEIEKIAAICAIASASFASAPALFHEGQPLTDVFRAFRMELLRKGAEEVPYLVGGAGQGGYTDVISPPSDQRLCAGDVLMLDTGATRHGYFCDFDRNFAIRHASEECASAYRILQRATDAALDIARPGATCRELFHAMGKAIGETGGDVGRYGHGLGMQLTEPPSLAGFDDTVLQAGMVITLEPGIALEGGRIMVSEENIVIRDGPPQMLSERAPPELQVIGG